MKRIFKIAGRRQWLSTAAALVIGTCAVSSAHAGADFCNNFKVPVFISVAYDDNGEWISKGWEKIEPGTCRVNPFALHVGQFYFRGETDWYVGANGKQTINRWGSQETTRFSVVNDRFNFRHAELEHPGSRQEGFVASFRNASGEISETITFTSDGRASQEASLLAN